MHFFVTVIVFALFKVGNVCGCAATPIVEPTTIIEPTTLTPTQCPPSGTGGAKVATALTSTDSFGTSVDGIGPAGSCACTGGYEPYFKATDGVTTVSEARDIGVDAGQLNCEKGTDICVCSSENECWHPSDNNTIIQFAPGCVDGVCKLYMFASGGGENAKMLGYGTATDFLLDDQIDPNNFQQYPFGNPNIKSVSALGCNKGVGCPIDATC